MSIVNQPGMGEAERPPKLFKYVPKRMIFNGATSYASTESACNNVNASGNVATVSAWVMPDRASVKTKASFLSMNFSTTEVFEIMARGSAGEASYIGYNGGFSIPVSVPGWEPYGDLTLITVAWDAGEDRAQLAINGTFISEDNTNQLNVGVWGLAFPMIGSVADGTTSASSFKGAVADLWLDDVFIDLDSAAGDAFMSGFRNSNGQPKFPGNRGELVTGEVPLLFFGGTHLEQEDLDAGRQFGRNTTLFSAGNPEDIILQGN